jgi:hypothetical protein
MAQQTAINNQLLSFIKSNDHSSVPMGDAADPVALSATATAINEEDEKKQQQRAVRDSRQSLYLHNSNLLSPLAPPLGVRPRTQDEVNRRASQGGPFTTPGPASPTQPHAGVPFIDKGRYSKYDQASQALKGIDKFYNDKKHDKDIDVYTFVRSVDFQLDRYMGTEQFGRLELVISCTAGSAQTWLLSKRDDLAAMIKMGMIAAERAEWNEIKELFIERMGGGQTERLNQTKLDELKMGRHGGVDEVMKFVTSFREYASRAYPLAKHPDTKARSLMLGTKFQERVRDSDFGVWRETMRRMPAPETLEEWELALSSAWATEQAVRDQQRKCDGSSVSRSESECSECVRMWFSFVYGESAESADSRTGTFGLVSSLL